MLIFAFVFLILAIIVLASSKRLPITKSSREYRVDSKTVGSVLLFIALAFFILATANG